MLMLLSVVFVGLAVFVIYKFKRWVSPSTISLLPSSLTTTSLISVCEPVSLLEICSFELYFRFHSK